MDTVNECHAGKVGDLRSRIGYFNELMIRVFSGMEMNLGDPKFELHSNPSLVKCAPLAIVKDSGFAPPGLGEG